MTESNDIPSAPKVVRKPHTTGSTNGNGQVNANGVGHVNGNGNGNGHGYGSHGAANGAYKTLDPAATNPAAGYTVS